MSAEYNKYNPEHRQIYRFIRTLFNAAQLTAECAIITLVYLERLLKVIISITNCVFLRRCPVKWEFDHPDR